MPTAVYVHCYNMSYADFLWLFHPAERFGSLISVVGVRAYRDTDNGRLARQRQPLSSPTGTLSSISNSNAVHPGTASLPSCQRMIVLALALLIRSRRQKPARFRLSLLRTALMSSGLPIPEAIYAVCHHCTTPRPRVTTHRQTHPRGIFPMPVTTLASPAGVPLGRREKAGGAAAASSSLHASALPSAIWVPSAQAEEDPGEFRKPSGERG